MLGLKFVSMEEFAPTIDWKRKSMFMNEDHRRACEDGTHPQFGKVVPAGCLNDVQISHFCEPSGRHESVHHRDGIVVCFSCGLSSVYAETRQQGFFEIHDFTAYE